MSPTIGSVIDGLTKAIELAKKTQGFFGQFESRKRRVFAGQIEPTFESLQAVIRSCEDDIASFETEIRNAQGYAEAEKALMELREKRRKTARERGELLSNIEPLSNKYWWRSKLGRDLTEPYIAYLDFMHHLSGYFFAYEHMGGPDPDRSGSAMTKLLEVAREVIHSNEIYGFLRPWPDAQAVILEQCAGMTRILEKRHISLFQSYARLRLVCVGVQHKTTQKS